MKMKMQAHDLWDAIEGGPVQFRDDRRALEVIVVTVPKVMGIPLLDKATTKEAWDAIAAARIGVDRVRRATLQHLRRDWENIGVNPGEQVEDFALRLSTLHQQLVIHGDKDITEQRVVEKFLRTVPAKYVQIVVAIEQFLDFEALTLEEVTGRLKEVDEREAQAVTEPVSIHQRQAVVHRGAVEGALEEGEARRRRSWRFWFQEPAWRQRQTRPWWWTRTRQRCCVVADVEKAKALAVLAPTRASIAIRKGIGRVNVPSRAVMEQSMAAGEETEEAWRQKPSWAARRT
jgi:hypothetical protein